MARPDKMPTHCVFFLPAGLRRVSEDDHIVFTRSRLRRLVARITKRAY
ncbi:MAG TPA: hypothetical protein VIL91_07615 [Gaiellaceae bacterium]